MLFFYEICHFFMKFVISIFVILSAKFVIFLIKFVIFLKNLLFHFGNLFFFHEICYFFVKFVIFIFVICVCDFFAKFVIFLRNLLFFWQICFWIQSLCFQCHSYSKVMVIEPTHPQACRLNKITKYDTSIHFMGKNNWHYS